MHTKNCPCPEAVSFIPTAYLSFCFYNAFRCIFPAVAVASPLSAIFTQASSCQSRLAQKFKVAKRYSGTQISRSEVAKFGQTWNFRQNVGQVSNLF